MLRIAKTRDLAPGEKVVREVHLDPANPPLKILLVCHPDGSGYSAMDAHCHHMGASLLDGDIEDLGNGRSCVVCPWHKRKIDLKTGHVMDTDLQGQLCLGASQQQRLYDIHYDDENIFVSIPSHPGKMLPSDKWNTQAQQPRGYGLQQGQWGTQAQVPPGSPLQPYAGQRGWPAGSPLPAPGTDAVMEDVLIDLSQQEASSPVPQARAPQPRRLDFGASRSLHGRGRNRAATEAILKNAYQAPIAKKPALSAAGDNRQRSIRDYFTSEH
jgi:nitrite reductase/ring-hydroxylating ferredoxin subunit